jgi:uncharacterized paraquat-inducible protein A
MAAEIVKMLCPNLKCRTVLSVPTSAQGKKVRCRACGTRIQVPEGIAPNRPQASAPTPLPDSA